jgi:hypothetical protein
VNWILEKIDGTELPQPENKKFEIEMKCSNDASDSTFPFCCHNGARNKFCCNNGAANEFCCLGPHINPTCSAPTTTSPILSCPNGAPSVTFPFCCKNGASNEFCCTGPYINPTCSPEEPELEESEAVIAAKQIIMLNDTCTLR